MLPNNLPIDASVRSNHSRRVEIAGALIDNVSMAEALSAIETMIVSKAFGYVVTPNADHVVRLQTDAEFREAYSGAALVVPDGVPLVWASRLLGTPLKERVAGSDLFERVCELAALRHHRLFLLGGRPGAAARAAEKIGHAGVRVVGHYSPPYGFENDRVENARIVRMIREASPDILFVGVGSPKQEKWIRAHGRACGAPVAIAVGVSFELVAGVVRRAPIWMQRHGLEWLWRLMMEPRRLWRRYLIEDPWFLWYVIEQRRRDRRSGHAR